MKKTALFNEHVALSAKMIEYASYELPVFYSSIVEEHNAVRNHIGIFDVSHMGEIEIKGQNAEGLLKKLLPTSMDKLIPGKCMYSCMCNENGGVIDDLFVYMYSKEHYLLVVNADTRQKDIDWITKQNESGVEIIDLSDDTSKIDVQGPESELVMIQIFDKEKIKKLERFYFDKFEFQNETVLISKTGYTGEKGYEVYCSNKISSTIWNRLITSGLQFGLKPAGLGARDILRLEASYSLYGHDLSENISPVESGIGWIINSAEDYIGKKSLAEQKNNPCKKLYSFRLLEKGIPRDGYKVFLNDKEMGYCTSGGFSPLLNYGIGNAIISDSSLKTGDRIFIQIRTKLISAEIVKKPFYSFNG